MAIQSNDLLTAAKWADQLGIPASKFKKAIQEMHINPDLVKGGCNYYNSKTANAIRKSVK